MNYGEQRQAQEVTLASERQRARRYLSNTNALESVMADIAEGTKLSDIAGRLNISYAALYGVMTSTYKEQYKAARAAYADLLAEKNLDMADKVQSLQLPADVAKVAAGLRHWHMERTASEQWGQRSSVDVNHKGVIGLHLEAIRQLSDEPLEGDYEEVDEEEVSRITRDDGDGPAGDDRDGADGDCDDDAVSAVDLYNHPLL